MKTTFMMILKMKVNHQEADTNNLKKCKGVSFEFLNNMRQLSGGIIHSQRRGQSDPLESSQSCTSPVPPPPPQHMSPDTVNMIFLVYILSKF
jgi:hypothetical protein